MCSVRLKKRIVKARLAKSEEQHVAFEFGSRFVLRIPPARLVTERSSLPKLTLRYISNRPCVTDSFRFRFKCKTSFALDQFRSVFCSQFSIDRHFQSKLTQYTAEALAISLQRGKAVYLYNVVHTYCYLLPVSLTSFVFGTTVAFDLLSTNH